MSTESNARERDRRKRRNIRAKLEAEGASPVLIEKVMEQLRFEHLVARKGEKEARRILYEVAQRGGLDDKGFEPSDGDPLLRGAGRADGMTAKVLKRRETITRFQYNQRTQS